jgi:hypothetical protein
MMYYKMIGDRQVFSTCKTIHLENDYPELELHAGQYVSNPSAELIAAEGWLEYVPPVIPPTPKTEPDYDELIGAVKKMLSTQAEELSDKDALDVAALFPTWASKLGMQVNVGERLWYDEKLYKVIQAHTTQEDWTPDVVPGLYTEVSILEWPEWVQPTGVQDAYMTGDKVTFEGTHYVSLIDNNTWSPAAYPQGWEERP